MIYLFAHLLIPCILYELSLLKCTFSTLPCCCWHSTVHLIFNHLRQNLLRYRGNIWEFNLQILPLPNGQQFRHSFHLVTYRGWKADHSNPTGSRSASWCGIFAVPTFNDCYDACFWVFLSRPGSIWLWNHTLTLSFIHLFVLSFSACAY